MNAAKIDNLGTMAAEIAMRAAIDYLKRNGKVAGIADAQIDRLLVLIRQCAKDAVGQALDEAGAALAAGMDRVAEATFGAAMTIAGIKAAKEYLANELNRAVTGAILDAACVTIPQAV